MWLWSEKNGVGAKFDYYTDTRPDPKSNSASLKEVYMSRNQERSSR
jgi:hypothetical protein